MSHIANEPPFRAARRKIYYERSEIMAWQEPERRLQPAQQPDQPAQQPDQPELQPEQLPEQLLQ